MTEPKNHNNYVDSKVCEALMKPLNDSIDRIEKGFLKTSDSIEKINAGIQDLAVKRGDNRRDIDLHETRLSSVEARVTAYDQGISKAYGAKMAITMLVAIVIGIAAFLGATKEINSTIEKNIVPKLIRIVNERDAAAANKAAPNP